MTMTLTVVLYVYELKLRYIYKYAVQRNENRYINKCVYVRVYLYRLVVRAMYCSVLYKCVYIVHTPTGSGLPRQISYCIIYIRRN